MRGTGIRVGMRVASQGGMLRIALLWLVGTWVVSVARLALAGRTLAPVPVRRSGRRPT